VTCKESKKHQETSSQEEHHDLTTGQQATLKEPPNKISTTKESTDHSTTEQTEGTSEEQLGTMGREKSTLELPEQDKMVEYTKQPEAQEMLPSQDKAKPPPQEQKEPAEQGKDTPKIPFQLSLKEWQWTQNKWLHSAMCAAIGDELAPEVENIKQFQEVRCGTFDNEIDVHPIRKYMTQYDLCNKVEAGKNQVELFHKAFCKWYLKVREANAQAMIYPWTEKVQDEEELLIESPTNIPTALPMLKKFVHKLFLRTTGGAYHI